MSKTSPKNGLKRPKVVFSENDEQQLVKDSFLGQCRDRLYVPKARISVTKEAVFVVHTK